MTGFGGAWVAPVVTGAFCGILRAHLHVPSRPFGAGFGTGTVCAEAGVAAPATDAAISSASPQRMPRWVKCCVIRYFGSLFNASSC